MAYKLQLEAESMQLKDELKIVSSGKASFEVLLEEEKITSAQLRDRIRDLEVSWQT